MHAVDNLVAGASITRQTTLQLPSGTLGSGALVAEVELDITNAVDETSGGIGRENNNIAEIAFTSLTDLLPDLTVSGITTAPAGGYVAGQSVTVRWRTENTGEAPVTSSFTEQLRIRNLSISGGKVIDLASLVYDHAREPDGR